MNGPVRLSVRLSVCLSVCHTFFTMSPSLYHHKLSGVITNDRSGVHAKVQGQMLKVKVAGLKPNLAVSGL